MTRRDAIDLQDVLLLLSAGNNLDHIAERLGVEPESIVRAFARRGTPDQRARIARARADLADEKRAAAQQARRTRHTSGARLEPRRRTA